jgi:hypothetical protein
VAAQDKRIKHLRPGRVLAKDSLSTRARPPLSSATIFIVASTASSSLLTAVLVGALLPVEVAEGRMIRGWLDSWAGIGHVLTR